MNRSRDAISQYIMLLHSNYHPIVDLQGQHGNKAFLLKYNSYFTTYQQQSYTH